MNWRTDNSFPPDAAWQRPYVWEHITDSPHIVCDPTDFDEPLLIFDPPQEMIPLARYQYSMWLLRRLVMAWEGGDLRTEISRLQVLGFDHRTKSRLDSMP